MAEAWADEKGAFWADRADWVSRMLAEPNQVLLDGIDLQPGERVLDIGCGCGDSTLGAAEAVGPDGAVLGLDLSPAQLDVARQRAEHRGLTNVEVRVADVTAVDLEAGSVDVLLSRFGVMFFDDPVAAFTRLRGALADGGRLAFVCWQSFERNEWVQVPAEAFGRVLDVSPEVPDDQPGGGSFRDPERVRSILEAAGFHNLRFDDVACTIDLGPDADDAVDFVRTMEYARKAMEAASPERVDTALAAARDALAAQVGPDGIRLGGRIWLVRAHT